MANPEAPRTAPPASPETLRALRLAVATQRQLAREFRHRVETGWNIVPTFDTADALDTCAAALDAALAVSARSPQEELRQIRQRLRAIAASVGIRRDEHRDNPLAFEAFKEIAWLVRDLHDSIPALLSGDRSVPEGDPSVRPPGHQADLAAVRRVLKGVPFHTAGDSPTGTYVLLSDLLPDLVSGAVLPSREEP